VKPVDAWFAFVEMEDAQEDAAITQLMVPNGWASAQS